MWLVEAVVGGSSPDNPFPCLALDGLYPLRREARLLLGRCFFGWGGGEEKSQHKMNSYLLSYKSND